jgi:hypothetical protein
MGKFDAVFNGLQDAAVKNNVAKSKVQFKFGKGIVATWNGFTKVGRTGGEDTPAEERFPLLIASFTIDEHPEDPKAKGKRVSKSYMLTQDKNDPSQPGFGWAQLNDLHKAILGTKLEAETEADLIAEAEAMDAEAGNVGVSLTIAENKNNPEYPNVYVKGLRSNK